MSLHLWFTFHDRLSARSAGIFDSFNYVHVQYKSQMTGKKELRKIRDYERLPFFSVVNFFDGV